MPEFWYALPDWDRGFILGMATTVFATIPVLGIALLDTRELIRKLRESERRER